MPVAFRAGFAFNADEEDSPSSADRSRPRDFLTAVLVFLGVERASFSSAARRASFSAFFRAASCFFASASSLWEWSERVEEWRRGRYFLALDLAPLLHSWSSADAFFALSAAAF